MFGGSSRKLVAGIFAAALVLGTPAAAQTYSDGYLFLKAVQDQDIDKADELLDKPGSTLINSRDVTNGRTGLHIAAERRDAVWLAYLLNRGANPNIADRRGVTPLMRASQLGFFEGIQYLVAKGARVDAPVGVELDRRDAADPRGAPAGHGDDARAARRRGRPRSRRQLRSLGARLRRAGRHRKPGLRRDRAPR